MDGGVLGGSVHDQQGVQASLGDRKEELCGKLGVKGNKNVLTPNLNLFYLLKDGRKHLITAAA